MTRRKLLGTLAAPILVRAAELRTNPARLRERLEALSMFGRPAGGDFSTGVSRLAYSDADVAGRAYIIKLMQAARLNPRIDAAGNIFGRREGTQADAAPVLFGSHIDSVPNGGNFDGDLGVLSAIEVIETLNAAQVKTRRPLDVVPASHGAGSRCIMRGAAGLAKYRAHNRLCVDVVNHAGARRLPISARRGKVFT